jgi:alpha-L-fucosidase 2
MWDAKYTTNINLQMNYWPVEGFNLPGCADPLIKFVKEITGDGARVAKEHYNARGWVFHQNSDLWRVAAPMDGPTWGTFTTAGAWLTNMLYEHYLYTMDTGYLREIYPVIKGSVQFFMDFLVKHPNGKWLVTNPSTSPENFPARPGNQPYFDEVTGSILPGTTICAGSSIDMQILYDLFTFYSSAAAKLHLDAAFAAKAVQVRDMLAPPQIGKNGMLQEWADDWGQLEDKHRHLSPLYGLYPGNELWIKGTPALVESYKKLLEERGDAGPGFSRAWKMCLWARLNGGNRSLALFKGYLKDQCYPQLFAKGGQALQVDATFGVAAGINEMLLQSHKGFIEVLPALPGEWVQGNIKGLTARGGFEVSLQWAGGIVTGMQVISRAGGICSISIPHVKGVLVDGKPADIQENGVSVISFKTVKGSTYTITPLYN